MAPRDEEDPRLAAVVELTEEQLDEELQREEQQQQEEKTERTKGPAQHSDHRSRAEQLLGWKRDRIWIINGTGADLVVYVHPFHKISQVVEKGCKLSGGVPGTVSAEKALKAALHNALVQEFNLPASDTGMVRVNLGPRQSPAYITARGIDSMTSLFCKNIIVKGGTCITIQGPPYEGELDAAGEAE